jgi:hypothetical protein
VSAGTKRAFESFDVTFYDIVGFQTSNKPLDRLEQKEMSDSDTDNRSAASWSSRSNSSNGPTKHKRFPNQPPGQRVQIGVEELRGFYYVYGKPDQAQVFRKTTEKIADHIAQNYKSGKEMYKLITYS